MKVEWKVSDEHVNKLQNKWVYCKEKSVFYKRKGTQYDIKFGKAIEGKVWSLLPFLIHKSMFNPVKPEPVVSPNSKPYNPRTNPWVTFEKLSPCLSPSILQFVISLNPPPDLSGHLPPCLHFFLSSKTLVTVLKAALYALSVAISRCGWCVYCRCTCPCECMRAT